TTAFTATCGTTAANRRHRDRHTGTDRAGQAHRGGGGTAGKAHKSRRQFLNAAKKPRNFLASTAPRQGTTRAIYHWEYGVCCREPSRAREGAVPQPLADTRGSDRPVRPYRQRTFALS